MITQNKKRDMLLSSLRQKLEYANNTSYYKIFRQAKRAQMILEISNYLESSKEYTGQKEEYILYSLLKLIAALMVERSPKIKKAVERKLQTLESYYKTRGAGGGNL